MKADKDGEQVLSIIMICTYVLNRKTHQVSTMMVYGEERAYSNALMCDLPAPINGLIKSNERV